ncbi:hypothetical protein HDK64DRAFT_55605 [Phyllosticta capitalensis]
MLIPSSAILLSLLGSALALPQPAPGLPTDVDFTNTTVSVSHLDKHTKIINFGYKNMDGVYFCTDYAFKGTCWHFGMDMNVCYNVNDPSRRGKVSSFGPDWGVMCDIYKGRGCSGKKKVVGYPGYKDLRSIFFDNQIASYNCREVATVQ